MKRNQLDKALLVLVVAFLGLIAVNRYVYQPIWKSEAKSEMQALKQELKEEHRDIRTEMKDAAKSIKEDAKDAAAASKLRLKQALD